MKLAIDGEMLSRRSALKMESTKQSVSITKQKRVLLIHCFIKSVRYTAACLISDDMTVSHRRCLLLFLSLACVCTFCWVFVFVLVLNFICWIMCRLTSNSLDADLNRQIDEHQGVIINTGQLVWAIAFGSKVPHTCQRSTILNWSRRIDDNILATGLQSGSIRTWNVKTGELNVVIWFGFTRAWITLHYTRSPRMHTNSLQKPIQCWHSSFHWTCLWSFIFTILVFPCIWAIRQM